MNEVTISELVREAQDKLKQIAALDSKIRWHVSRAGSGGSHKKADRYNAERVQLQSEADELARRARTLIEREKSGKLLMQTAAEELDEVERKLAPRTELNAKSLKEWAKATKPKDPINALRVLALRCELYGMQDWRGKDFRESVTDWFWEGLTGVKGYSETTAIKSVLETAKSFMEDDTSLEELLKELHGDDLGEED